MLDAAAVSAFSRGSLFVGERIAEVAARDGDVLVPVLCLAEAFRTYRGTEYELLYLLRNHSHVTVLPVEEPDSWVIGSWARKIGSLHLAQAAMEAADRPLVPLLTASRDKVTEHLPKEWPIIDL